MGIINRQSQNKPRVTACGSHISLWICRICLALNIVFCISWVLYLIFMQLYIYNAASAANSLIGVESAIQSGHIKKGTPARAISSKYYDRIRTYCRKDHIYFTIYRFYNHNSREAIYLYARNQHVYAAVKRYYKGRQIEQWYFCDIDMMQNYVGHILEGSEGGKKNHEGSRNGVEIAP